MHINLDSLRQFNDSSLVIKGVFKGEQSEGVLLSLLPGQIMPTHSHKNFEVVLLPREGQATLTVNSHKQVHLSAGTLYFEPSGSTFQIENTGAEPFQVLITLIRVTAEEEEAHPTTEG